MKKILATALAITITGAAGSIMAADTAELDVTATVVATCVVTADNDLAFGSIASTGADKTAKVNVSVQCTTGTSYTLTDDTTDGASSLVDETDATNTIPYTISYTGSGTADGSAQDIEVTGTITAANMQNATVGTYEDSILFTVNP